MWFGWSVVQLDFYGELELLHGRLGSMDAELEVQRTIKRLEVTAFFCLFKKVIGPIKVHVDNKGIKDVLWRGEMHGPEAVDADLWIKIFGKSCIFYRQKKYCWKLEHVKAHRAEKDKA